ncbi:hypothetical protein Ancab_018897 [Ancistrocladus abbreviatus]
MKMAGSLMLSTEIERQEKSLIVINEDQQFKWEVQYSRFFNYPPHIHATSIQPPLSLIQRRRFKGTWLSSSELSSPKASLHLFRNCSYSGAILAVHFQGRIIEEHFISKLHFTWPQVSCVSGFPARGSLVVFVSYKDCTDETQKFALRFSTINETETFMACLEDTIFKKKDVVREFTSEVSSQSEFVPPPRPAGLSIGLNPTHTSEIIEMTPVNSSQTKTSQQTEVEQLPYSQDFTTSLNSQVNFPAFPPSFKALVTNCYSQTEQALSSVALTATSEEIDLKSQIAKYMQDSSFLDMLNKVEEVIGELGRDLTPQ